LDSACLNFNSADRMFSTSSRHTACIIGVIQSIRTIKTNVKDVTYILAVAHRIYALTARSLFAGGSSAASQVAAPAANRFDQLNPHSVLGLHLGRFDLESRALPKTPSRQ
jgi:hypothetical protein